MKIKASILLNWRLRKIGARESESIVDLWFDKESNKFLFVQTKTGKYDIKGGVFRHGELLACAETTEKEAQLGQISYQQLLGAVVYDEEGSILGAIGDLQIDCEQLRLTAVDLSGGIISDLLFGRKRVSMEHLKDMLVELEGK